MSDEQDAARKPAITARPTTVIEVSINDRVSIYDVGTARELQRQLTESLATLDAQQNPVANAESDQSDP